MRVAALVAVAIAVIGLDRPAHAQSADVPTWIALVEQQPAGMDRTTWRDKRRDAARKLASSGDKRAVPVLIKLVENETFDIIGEIAIEGLGQLGDKSAVPVLQKVASDQSRDANQRKLAKAALAKLGADPDDTGDGGDGDGDGGKGDSGKGDGDGGKGDDLGGGTIGGVLLGTPIDDTAAPVGPTWGDDVLAATERLTFALGTASLAYNTAQSRSSFDLDVAGTYLRSLDREASHYHYGADARVVAGANNPEGPASTKLLIVSTSGHGEFRAYTKAGVYAVAFGGMRLEGSRLSNADDDPAQPVNSDRFAAFDLDLGIGGGWGRVLDVGARLRVARIAGALEQARALGRPIDDAIARKLQSAWWALRGELGSHRRLTSTVAILREAGVLLGEPDAGLTYELLQILADGQLDGRSSGIDVQLAFSEGYRKRWRFPADEDPTLPDGRIEQLLIRARFARQLGDESDATADLFGRYRALAPEMQASPWALGVRAGWRKFVYADHFDPRGALDVSVELAISSDGREDDATQVGVRLGGEVGWSLYLSRASSIRVAGEAAIDAGELFIGASVEARYGWLDNSFAGSL